MDWWLVKVGEVEWKHKRGIKERKRLVKKVELLNKNVRLKRLKWKGQMIINREKKVILEINMRDINKVCEVRIIYFKKWMKKCQL